MKRNRSQFGGTPWSIALGLIILAVLVFLVLRDIGGDPRDNESKAAQAVDDGLGLSQKKYLDRGKNVASLAEMQQIETALVMFEMQRGRPPENLEEVIDAGLIGDGAARDSYGNVYRIQRGPDGRWEIRSAGTSQIFGTKDDQVRQLTGSSGLAEKRPTPPPPNKPVSPLDLVYPGDPRYNEVVNKIEQ